jgi:DNA binding domain, excisionase family
MKEKTWLTTRQAAYLLKVSIRTVQIWVDIGKIKAIITPGGHRRIARSEFASNLTEISPLKYDIASQKNVNALRVLIVEDDYVILRLCEMKFAQFKIPHELFLATNAFQGLVMVGKHLPDIILTDLNMPGFDGIQMLNEILKVPDMSNTKNCCRDGLGC